MSAMSHAEAVEAAETWLAKAAVEAATGASMQSGISAGVGHGYATLACALRPCGPGGCTDSWCTAGEAVPPAADDELPPF